MLGIEKVICLDFDGVINDYKGWRDEGFDVILDEPFADTAMSIHDIRTAGYRVIVNSVRCAHAGGIDAIRKWLERYDIEVDDVTEYKPLACIYVDDRGYKHTTWPDTIDMVKRLSKES